MSIHEQWQSDIFAYNERYEKLNIQIRDHTNRSLRFLRSRRPTPEVSDELLELSRCLQKLVDLRAEAGYIYRGVKQFYEVTRSSHKRNLIKEKKLAANVASDEAQELSALEFDTLNEAESNFETADRRWEATKEMLENLRTKLIYGYEP